LFWLVSCLDTSGSVLATVSVSEKKLLNSTTAHSVTVLVLPAVRSYRIVGRPLLRHSSNTITWTAGTGRENFFVVMEMGIKLREPIGTGQNPPERGRERKINGGWGDDGQILFYCVGI